MGLRELRAFTARIVMTTLAVFSLTLGIGVTAAAAAQGSPTPDGLESLILPEALPKFRPSEDLGFPSGVLTKEEIENLLAPDGGLPSDQLAAIEAVARTWTHRRGDRFVAAILYRFPSRLYADLIMAGLRQQASNPAFATTFDAPSVPGSFGTTMRVDPKDGVQGHQIFFQRDRIIAHLMTLAAAGTTFERTDIIHLAERQAARLPAAAAPTASAPDEAVGSLGYQLGVALGIAIPILIVVFVFTRRARRLRAAPVSEAPPPVPGAEMPIPLGTPNPARGLRLRSQVLIALLGIAGALTVVSAIIGFGLIDRWTRLRDGRRINVETFQSLGELYDGLAVVQLVAILVTGIAWMIWQHRAQKTLLALRGHEGFRFTPGWAAGWWVVPLANLFMPFLTMKELYRGSADPESEMARGRGRRGLLLVWWLAFLATSLMGFLIRSLDDSLAELVLQSKIEFAIDLCYLLAAATAMGLVTLVFGGLKAQADRPTVLVVADGPLVPASPVAPPPLPPPLP